MQRHDRAALTQALAMCRAEDEGRAWQIDSMLEDRPWAEVARFAASCCQCRALKLYPWQSPPCDVDEDGDDGEINADGVKLLRKMLAAGLSRYEPDPLAALKAAKREQRAPDFPTSTRKGAA
jgi:hypothetical protein